MAQAVRRVPAAVLAVDGLVVHEAVALRLQAQANCNHLPKGLGRFVRAATCSKTPGRGLWAEGYPTRHGGAV